MDVKERLDWLAKHDNSVSRFTPQPYVQLVNMLRQKGFAAEAAQVLVRREDKQRAADWERAMNKVGVSLKQELIAFAHQYRPLMSLRFKWIFGYGHNPARASLWVAGLVAITTWFSNETYIRGQFAPISAVVLTSKEWLDVFPDAALSADSPLWKLQLEGWAPPRARLRGLSRLALCAGRVYTAGCFGVGKNMGPLRIARLVGRAGPPVALAGANVRLGDYRRRRGRGYRVDRPTGLTFRALRVMGGAC